MKRLLITGAGGFLGTTLLKHCLLKGEYDLWAMTSNEEKLRENVGENVTIVTRDYPFSEEFKTQKFDCVINCAYPRNTSGKEVAEGLSYLSAVFHEFNNAQVKSVINISSQSVYDANRNDPATESSSPCLDTPYAVGKYAVELLLDSICTNTAHTNIRMASLIGPGFNQRIVNRLIQKAVKKEPILINKSDRRMGFLDVDDAAEGILSLLNIDYTKWKRVYNLGNGEGYSVENIVTMIESVFQARNIPFPTVDVGESAESGSTAVAFDLLNKDTGFKPQVSLKQSIQSILDDISQNG